MWTMLSSFVPSPNGCDSERGAVDAGIGSDLHVISDFDAPDLRELLVSVPCERETRSRRSDDAAGMQNGAGSDGDVGVYSDPRMQFGSRDQCARRAN